MSNQYGFTNIDGPVMNDIAYPLTIQNEIYQFWHTDYTASV